MIQVKAILSRDEVARCVKNCRSLELLKPWFGQGDFVYREYYGVRPHWQAPYICFCFSSELADVTLLETLDTSSTGVEMADQIDAIFVLDRGWSLLNFREGSPRFTNAQGQQIVGWCLLRTGADTLLEMLKFIHLTTPRILRINSLLQGYTDHVDRAATEPLNGLFKVAG